MEPCLFVVILLAVWRVTHLTQAEDGPFDIIFKLRKLAGNSFFGHLMDCFYCFSIWVALAPGLYFGRGWIEKILLWFALSGGAILLEKITNRDNNSSTT
jgi:Protein of unknown function (DUF1360)